MFFKSHKSKATTKTQTKTSHGWTEDIFNVFMKVNGLSIIQINKKSSLMTITKIVNIYKSYIVYIVYSYTQKRK